MSVRPFFIGACNQRVVVLVSWGFNAIPLSSDFNKQNECCLRNSLSRLNASFVRSVKSRSTDNGNSWPSNSPSNHLGDSVAANRLPNGSLPEFVKCTVIGIISPAITSSGMLEKLTCNADTGGRTEISNFLSYCGGFSSADGPSGRISIGSKSIFPFRLVCSFVACKSLILVSFAGLNDSSTYRYFSHNSGYFQCTGVVWY